MTKYKENDIIFYTKNVEFEVAVVIDTDYLPSGCYMTIVTQEGKTKVVKDSDNNVFKITDGTYNFLDKKYQKMIDNFDAKKAIANYKKNRVDK